MNFFFKNLDAFNPRANMFYGFVMGRLMASSMLSSKEDADESSTAMMMSLFILNMMLIPPSAPLTSLSFLAGFSWTVRASLVKKNDEKLGSVDNSSSESLRPAACPRDPRIMFNAKHDCTETDRTGARGQAAGPRDLNCQQTLVIKSKL